MYVRLITPLHLFYVQSHWSMSWNILYVASSAAYFLEMFSRVVFFRIVDLVKCDRVVTAMERYGVKDVVGYRHKEMIHIRAPFLFRVCKCIISIHWTSVSSETHVMLGRWINSNVRCASKKIHIPTELCCNVQCASGTLFKNMEVILCGVTSCDVIENSRSMVTMVGGVA